MKGKDAKILIKGKEIKPFATNYGLSFKEYIGQKNSKVILENVKKGVIKYFDKMAQNSIIAKDYKLDKVMRLWDSFSLYRKLKWWIYNKVWPFKELAECKREILDNERLIRYLEAKIEYPKDDPLDHIERIEYPPILEPNPKSIVVMDIDIKPSQPLDYVNLNFEIPKEDKNE